MGFGGVGGEAPPVSMLTGTVRSPDVARHREIYGSTPASAIRGPGAILVSGGECREYLPRKPPSRKGMPPTPPNVTGGWEGFLSHHEDRQAGIFPTPHPKQEILPG